MKFKDFQAPVLSVLFSSTFKALNLGEINSRTFKYFQGCVGTLIYVCKFQVSSLKSFKKASCTPEDEIFKPCVKLQ